MSISAGQLVAERLRQVKFFLYADSIPNVQIVLEACQRNEIEPELIWREDVVDDVIERCIEGATFGSYTAKLSENARLRGALDGCYTRYPRFARNIANDRMIIEAAARHQIRNFDAATLVSMVTEDATLFNSLATSVQWNDQQAALREREQSIAFLAANGSFTVGNQRFDKGGFLIQHSSSGGRRKVANDEGFPGWTDEQLRYAVQQVKLKRELKDMDTDALARRVRAEGQQRIAEKYHGDPSKFVPPMPTDQTQAVVLIDPRDGSTPITTRLQLLAYIRSSQDALARLVRNKQGKSVPERALAVDRLLATR